MGFKEIREQLKADRKEKWENVVTLKNEVKQAEEVLFHAILESKRAKNEECQDRVDLRKLKVERDHYNRCIEGTSTAVCDAMDQTVKEWEDKLENSQENLKQANATMKRAFEALRKKQRSLCKAEIWYKGSVVDSWF